MRPKKKVVMWGATEMAASLLRLVLESKRYVVITAASAEEVIERIEAAQGVFCDAPASVAAVLLLDPDGRERDAMEARCREADASVRIVSRSSRVVKDGGMAELLESLRMATAVRPGPMPDWKRNILAEQQARRAAEAERAA